MQHVLRFCFSNYFQLKINYSFLYNVQ
uniref:Uncharacterized protein n=1 Tax=Arundo donax TaxID=35708 RepID=A0A0A8Z2U7_ARUDO